METETLPAPAGYKPLPEGLGFTDVLRPVYRREHNSEVSLGMYVQLSHCNMIGICHGGALMTLADIGAASAINFAREKIGPAPTLNLSFDFINAAREGDWLQTRSEQVTLKRSFGFASGVIISGEKLVCRYSGSFYQPDHDGFKGQLDKLAAMHGKD
ncbi:PaaI family thioesterase [Halieaceae bacterium IMCC14734]|uniref:PaaI family thioesterase n=1 Tax=Candidatus Litorirhabdus singularis TaxID=2518993 RepID=A0ABT3THA0_9GAMM|nr:PaaI family thioesterase [Candidatus Litorirhabdus singularis]MCX2981682.1 PaaI family thioesterase [Candidatus Litorirhabdus singularis]